MITALLLSANVFAEVQSITSYYGGELTGKNSTLQLGTIYFSISSPTPPASEATTQLATPEAVPIITEGPILKAPEAKPEIALTPETKPTSPATQEAKLPAALTSEPTPEINVWFDNRSYQNELKSLSEKGEEIIISRKPKIKLEVKISSPYSLNSNAENYSIVLDSGDTSAKTFSLQSLSTTQQIALNSAVFEYSFPEELPDGKHTLTFIAKSSGSRGLASQAEQKLNVVIKSGPVSIVGEAIHFPSPYSPTKHRSSGITLQYTLTTNADIDIYVFSVAGEIAKKITCMSGSEGGTAGLNKTKWDGNLDSGGIIGNGIYIATIVAKADGKILKKLKINVFD